MNTRRRNIYRLKPEEILVNSVLYCFVAFPQGIIVIEVTSDLVSQKMADKIIEISEEMKGKYQTRVQPMLLTNIVESKTALDARSINLINQKKIFILTREDIIRIFKDLYYNRSATTGDYWRQFSKFI